MHGWIEDMVQEMLREDSQTGDPYAELAKLDPLIAKVEKTLAKLVRKRAPLKTRINELSPMIDLLPPEIISHIFTFCIANFHQFDTQVSNMADSAMPLPLGAICKRWREIAWTTPALWSSLHLHFNGQDLDGIAELTKDWLARSGQLPLSIRISCEPKPNCHNYAIVASPSKLFQFISILNIYSARWRDLDIRIPMPFFEGFHPDGRGISSLETLYIDPPDGQSDSTHILELRCTPRLRTLHLDSVCLTSVKVQWESITHIYASAFYVSECLEILQRTPRLVSCVFPFIIDGEDNYALAKTPIILPSLKVLHLGRELLVSLAPFLDNLVLPSLVEFVYDGRGKTWDSDAFLSLFTRSACRLRACTLRAVSFEEADFVRVMEQMPSLIELSMTVTCEYIHPSFLTDDILAHISAAPSPRDDGFEKPFLPELQILNYSGPQTFSWTHLLAIMECGQRSITEQSQMVDNSRLKSPRRSLNTVTMQNDRIQNIDAKLIPRFTEILEQGKCLDIRENSVDVLERSLSNDPPQLQRYLDLRQRIRRPHTSANQSNFR